MRRPRPSPSRTWRAFLEAHLRIYGDGFRCRISRMGIHEVLIAPHAPWQNPFAERVIGPSAANASTTSLCSTRSICVGCYAPTSSTTTPFVHTRRSATTAHCRETSSRRRAGASSRFRRSAAFITATSAPPECPPRFGSSSVRGYVARRSCTAEGLAPLKPCAAGGAATQFTCHCSAGTDGIFDQDRWPQRDLAFGRVISPPDLLALRRAGDGRVTT